MRILIYVQHLLGIGHLHRSLWLARALARENFGVTVISGGISAGLPAPAGVTMIQLPAVASADNSFSRLLDLDGNEIDDAFRDRRRSQLLEAFASIAPQVLITETFPFGRRMMRFELLPLLRAAKSRSRPPIVIASIRDILQPKSKPGRNDEIVALLERYYDRVIVHGDPAISRLEDSFALAGAIAGKIAYSGYISAPPAPEPPADDGRNEVIVSAGGSATGLALLDTALAARDRCSLSGLFWRLLVSPAIEPQRFADLRRRADAGTRVERNRSDFTGLLGRARLSISQAGYNTITDILRTGINALVVPFAEAGEIEQTLRARRLQQLGRLVMLEPERLSAANLAAAIEQADALRPELEVDLEGAANSARLIREWLSERSLRQ